VLALVVLAAALCLMRRARASKQVSGMYMNATSAQMRTKHLGSRTPALHALQRVSWPGQTAGRRDSACSCNNEVNAVRSCLAGC